MRRAKRHNNLRSKRQWQRGRKNFAEVSRSLGYAREDYVLRILEMAKATGAILDVRRTKQNSIDDAQYHRDIIITDLRGREHSLQIKSSESDAFRFRERYPQIPVFVARLAETPRQTIDKLSKIFPFLKDVKLKT